VVYNERFSLLPGITIQEEASNVHGIYDGDLVGCPTFMSQEKRLKRITDGKVLIAYNAKFDDRMLEQTVMMSGASAKFDFYDIMIPWSNFNESNKWLKLKGGDHSALGDCKATLKCLNKMAGINITNPISFGINMFSKFIDHKLEQNKNNKLKEILYYFDVLLTKNLTKTEYDECIFKFKLFMKTNHKDEVESFFVEKYTKFIDLLIEDDVVDEEEIKRRKVFDSILIDFKREINDIKMGYVKELILNCLVDGLIEKSEIKKIKNFVGGLGVPNDLIIEDVNLINEIMKIQKEIKYPLEPITKHSENLTKLEHLYFVSSGTMMKRINRKSEPDGYKLEPNKSGKLLITSKKLIIIDGGVSRINLKSILNISIDYYENRIEVIKDTGVYPVYLESNDIKRIFKSLEIATKMFFENEK
jgi:hypothetical protein